MLTAVFFAPFIIGAGWWGRYDLPVIVGLLASGIISFGFDGRFHFLPLIGLGLVLAYLRRPVVHPDWPMEPF